MAHSGLVLDIALDWLSMNLLVGIPVFRLPQLVRRCLRSVVGHNAMVLAIDNAADKDVKGLLADEFNDSVKVEVSPTNEYCNGAWNRIMRCGLDHGYDTIALGSSDAFLHPGWFAKLTHRVDTRTNEVWIPKIGAPTDEPDEVATNLGGYFTFMPSAAVELVYPIPASIRHWFGDQYMYEKLRRKGWRTMVMSDVTAHHQQSAITAATPEAYAVIEADKVAWKALQDAAGVVQ